MSVEGDVFPIELTPPEGVFLFNHNDHIGFQYPAGGVVALLLYPGGGPQQVLELRLDPLVAFVRVFIPRYWRAPIWWAFVQQFADQTGEDG